LTRSRRRSIRGRAAVEIVEADQKADVIFAQVGDLSFEAAEADNDLAELVVNRVEALVDAAQIAQYEVFWFSVFSHLGSPFSPVVRGRGGGSNHHLGPACRALS
jgi:hypothetical protein